MSTFARRVALSTIEADLSAARWVSALRRAAVVVVVLVLGIRFASVDLAVSAATAALLIGLLDKGRSPRSTWRTMAAGTALLCVVTLFDSLLSTSTLAMLLLMAFLAFASGVSSGVDPRAPQIFVFGAILAATHLVAPIDVQHGLGAAALIALAGGLQTVLAFASAPIVGDLPERRRIAASLQEVAINVDAVGHLDHPDLRAGTRAASAAMAAAEDYVSRSDLAADHRSRYALLLADADVLRIEARGYYARENLGLPIPADRQTREIFVDSGRALSMAATVIGREQRNALESLDDQVTALQARIRRSQEAGQPVTRTASAVVDATSEIPGHVRDIMRLPQPRRERRDNPRPVRDRIAASLSWGSRPLKFGARMALAAVVGELIAMALHLTHGSWVAVSAMMLLRPDVGPAAPRIFVRAVGVSIGVACVVGLSAIIGDSVVWQVVAVTLLVFLMYAVVSVNQGTQIVLMTTTIILMLSITGLDPTRLAFARWIDVMIGCAIGTGFALAIPLWSRTSLPTDTAKYADAVAAWIDSLVNFTGTDPANRAGELDQIRRGGRSARDARQTVTSTFNASLLEPPDPNLNPGGIGVVLSWIRRCSDSGVAAETLLRHGNPMTPPAMAFGNEAARDLHSIAATLRSSEAAEIALRDQSSLPDDLQAADRVTEVMQRAARTANAALRAALRVGSRT